MPTDETRRLLKRFGIAVTEYEDAVRRKASPEDIERTESEVEECLGQVRELIRKLQTGPLLTPTADPEIKILRDLESKYSTVACPIHDVPPGFELAADGSVIERFCCEALVQIFRELKASEGFASTVPSTEPPTDSGT